MLRFASPAEVSEELLSGGFDLLVLSEAVGEKDKIHILEMVSTRMRTLVLTSFVHPDQLLAMVKQALA
jgi:hypothetical protein